MIRLSKICRELNIGLVTIINVLKELDIEVEASPNARLTMDQYNLFLKEYAKLPIRILPWVAEPFTDDAKKNRIIINSHGWNTLKNDHFVLWENKAILIPRNFIGSELKYWEINDIKSKCPYALIQNKAIKINQLCEPSGIIKVVPSPIIQTSINSSLNGNSKKSSLLPNVVDTIDLSSLNASTRPKRKSKEEMRKEREERKSNKQEIEKINSEETKKTIMVMMLLEKFGNDL